MLQPLNDLLSKEPLDLDAALAFLKAHSPRKGIVQRLLKSRNAETIRYELQWLWQEAALAKPEKPVVLAAHELADDFSRNSISQRNAISEQDAYPDHYPDILVQKLIEARRLISEKARLSNTLHREPKRNKKQEVDMILELSDRIGEIYAVKKSFDQTGRLPLDWLAAEGLSSAQELSDAERQEILTRIKQINSNISKTNAKLHNPNECRLGKPEEWRSKLRTWEMERAKLKIKLGM